MNQARRPLASRPRLPGLARHDDREFLPAALSILERPPSPVALALMSAICAFAVIALAWAWLGWTDIVAVAQGKVQPAGRVKTVQPLETGKVKAILAVNGDRVREGDPLVELDPQEALADVQATSAALSSARAEVVRRDAVVEAAARVPVKARPITWPDIVPAIYRQREEALQQADLASLAGQVRALDAQSEQKRAERDRLAGTIKAQEELVATLRDRVDMRESLLDSKSGTKSGLIDALESLNYHKMILAGQRGQAVEADRAMEALTAEKEKVVAGFVADNMAKRAEAQRQVDDLEARLAKAQLRAERMTLRSPVGGTVQASSVTSLGQVLSTGQEVMRVVPDGAGLEIEVYLENRDIGFVREGQEATIKVEAFPFTRYGVLDAKVVRVASDAIPQPDAQLAEADPTRPAESRSAAGGQRVQNLVFPVVLRTEAAGINADGKLVPLSPGMAVTAEIKTGQRRILEYLLSPVVEVSTQAMRER